MTLFKNSLQKFCYVKKHGSGEWGLLALELYGHEEILQNSSFLKQQKKMAMVLSKIQVNDPGPSWQACLYSYGKIIFRSLEFPLMIV